jgi:hypothetical protein
MLKKGTIQAEMHQKADRLHEILSFLSWAQRGADEGHITEVQRAGLGHILQDCSEIAEELMGQIFDQELNGEEEQEPGATPA